MLLPLCILVDVDPGRGDEAEIEFRVMEHIEDLLLWHLLWYPSNEDVGEYEQDHPGDGEIVIGAKSPEDFKRLLLQFSNELHEAMMEIMDSIEEEITVNRQWLQDIWNNETDRYFALKLREALKLITGDYIVESHFYSIPDDAVAVSQKTLRDALEHPEKYALMFLNPSEFKEAQNDAKTNYLRRNYY